MKHKTAPKILQCGIIDLSTEIGQHEGFKSLSWWEERGTRVIHAFISVGVSAEPLEGITPAEQFSDWIPWLNPSAITNGDLRPMDVFADSELDWGFANFAGIYLGSEVVADLGGQEKTAMQILRRCHPRVNDIEVFLWGLWDQAPYAYLPQTSYDERCIKSAHQATFNADVITLMAKPLTLL